MNKEEKEMLIEMRENCLKASTYDDEKRLLKANAITKALMLEEENKQLKSNWNKLKKELKEKYEIFKDVEGECLRMMAQEDDSILFSMNCIEKGE